MSTCPLLQASIDPIGVRCIGWTATPMPPIVTPYPPGAITRVIPPWTATAEIQLVFVTATPRPTVAVIAVPEPVQTADADLLVTTLLLAGLLLVGTLAAILVYRAWRVRFPLGWGWERHSDGHGWKRKKTEYEQHRQRLVFRKGTR